MRTVDPIVLSESMDEDFPERVLVGQRDDGAVMLWHEYKPRGKDYWRSWQDSGISLTKEEALKLRDQLCAWFGQWA